MLTSSTPFSRPLGNGLTLKSVSDLHDVERVAALVSQILNEQCGALYQALITHHPYIRPDYWLFVEDDHTHQAVSTLNLIPWQWRYEDVSLNSGEVAIVATLDSYRNRGLIRAMMVRHHELLREGGFELSHIQGIPYFYRQFGYEYAMPLESGWRIEFHNLPEAMPGGYGFRPASLDDLPLLMRMYDEANCHLSISACRDEGIWHYLFEHSGSTEMSGEIWLVTNGSGQPVGYWRLLHHGFGKGVIVSEASRMSHQMALASLCQLRTIAMQQNKPDIRLNLPASSDLVQTALCYNAYDLGTYAWQIHLVDHTRLFRRLAPVLESRLSASPLAGLTETVHLNLYRDAVHLHFESGILRDVTSSPACESEINIPPLLLAPLVLGYRSREELHYMYPDVGIWGQGQHLVDVLFPKVDSFLSTIY